MPDILITDVLATLSTKQLALAITSPIAAQIKQVFTLPPNRAQELNSFPCIINSWQLNSIEWGLDVLGGPRHEYYTISSQLFINDADLNQGALIATAFMNKMIVMIHDDYTFGGQSQQVDIRGGDPTLALLEWAGQAYPGLNIFFDVEIRN